MSGMSDSGNMRALKAPNTKMARNTMATATGRLAVKAKR